MALRLRWAPSCGEDRLVGSRGWLRLIRPSRVAFKRWLAVGGLSPAVANPAQPRVGNSAAVCPIYVDPSDGKGGCADAVIRPGGEGIPEDDKEAGRRKGGGRAPVPSEMIDRWMQECIGEIVRNIGEAPFLVHVFCNNDQGGGGGIALKLEVEAAEPEKWGVIRSRWDRGVATPPDGVILVEELMGEGANGGRASTTCDGGAAGFGASGTKVWGIVVQARGVDDAACYILNTCRVRSTLGFCTHFCLTRARCFEDTADVQLREVWLVGRGRRQQ